MPKMKTHSASKKRFRIGARTVKSKYAKRRSDNTKRRNKLLWAGDTPTIRKLCPYTSAKKSNNDN